MPLDPRSLEAADPNLRPVAHAQELERRVLALERQLAALRIGNDRLVAPSTAYYVECSGGADQALPNTGAKVYQKRGDGTDASFTFTVPTGATHRWWLYGQLLVRADSANDTYIYGGLEVDGSDFATAELGRLYWHGTSANLQAWSTLTAMRRFPFGEGTHTVKLFAAINAGAFGGFSYRADPIYGWKFGAVPISQVIAP
jgi:hypothetical protein